MIYNSTLKEIRTGALGLAFLGLLGGAVYKGCIASRTIEDAVVTEADSYKAYYDADSPVYDFRSYITLDTKRGCFDVNDLKEHFSAGEHITLRYKPIFALFPDCNYTVLHIQGK